MKEADNLESVFFFYISVFKGRISDLPSDFHHGKLKTNLSQLQRVCNLISLTFKDPRSFFPKRLLFFLTRFLTIDYKEEYYTREGLDWVESSTMKDILLRNFPEVSGLDKAMKNITNAFYVWSQ